MPQGLLAARLVESCLRHHGQPALVDADERLTYGDLLASARAVARALETEAIAADEPVLVAVSGRAADLVALLAVWIAGGVAVPLHRRSAARTVERVRALTGARLRLDARTDLPGTPGIAGGEQVEVLGEPPDPAPMLEGAAWVMCTSGSTGEPKGVVHGHDAYAAKLAMIETVLGRFESGRTLLVLQLGFAFGQWVSLLTLLGGGAVVVHERFEAGRAVAAVEDGVERIALVPTMARLLCPLLDSRRSRRHTGMLMLGGEPLAAPLARSLLERLPRARLWDIYGLAETGTCDFFVAPEAFPGAAGTIGRPGPGITHRVAPDGELQVRTPFVMRGYLGEPELGVAAFDGEWLRTGDLARERADGNVELIGRKSDLIVRAGVKIAPLEVERVMLEHPDVVAALAAGVPDPIRGESVHVLVVPRAGARIDAEALRRFAAQQLDGHKRPDAVHLGRELPLGATGKADRGALRRMLGRSP